MRKYGADENTWFHKIKAKVLTQVCIIFTRVKHQWYLLLQINREILFHFHRPIKFEGG